MVKEVIFLGGKTSHSLLFSKMRKVLCLDFEENKFYTYEKNRSLVKNISEIIKSLNVKNLVLYHIGDFRGNCGKKLYLSGSREILVKI